MKKNVLALSIATLIGGLGFAGAASAALSVSESGAGNILLVPYYSAQEGNLSVFHLTNTDTINGKAVKVRFRGAANSDVVLDFQVFMSPGDVWTGIVSQNPATGLANLLTVDNTCTLPALPAAGKDFVTDRLTRADWTAADKAAQTREGYVEILNMADIPATANGTNGLFKATKHVNGKAPCTTAVLDATADLRRTGAASIPASSATASNITDAADHYQGNDAYVLKVDGKRNTTADLVAPTGGLTGQWYIMNLEQNTTFSGVMPAVKAVGDVAPLPVTRVLNVFSPQLEEPAQLATADPLMVGATPIIKPQMYDVPDLSTAYVGTGVGDVLLPAQAVAQAKALTNLLKNNTVINQYATDVELDAKTDWVFSMPTRRYTSAADYTKKPTETGYRVIDTTTPGVTDNLFSTLANSSVDSKGQICVKSADSKFWDREEQSVGKGPVFSPGTQTSYSLCGEVGVLAFQEGTSALGASLTRQTVKAPYVNGWGSVTFGTNAATAVPVLGASFMKLTNLKIGNGIVANYGVTWAHTYK